jgi:hypothetical protein
VVTGGTSGSFLQKSQKSIQGLTNNPRYTKVVEFLERVLKAPLSDDMYYYFSPELVNDSQSMDKTYLNDGRIDEFPSCSFLRQINKIKHWEQIKKEGPQYKSFYGFPQMQEARDIALRYLEIPDEDAKPIKIAHFLSEYPELLEKWHKRLQTIRKDDPSKLQKINEAYAMLTNNDNEILLLKEDGFKRQQKGDGAK